MAFKKTNKLAIGTSFHQNTIKTSVSKLREVFGLPRYEINDGEDKVNFQWVLDFNGHIITIYDWKEYRVLNEDEIVEWHIGGVNGSVTTKATKEIEKLLK